MLGFYHEEKWEYLWLIENNYGNFAANLLFQKQTNKQSKKKKMKREKKQGQPIFLRHFVEMRAFM